MDRMFLQFTSLGVQDRIASMLQTELFRGQYPVTKVTTKMLFTVDFFSRPLDHFLASEATPVGQRAVHHDDTQWGGRDSAPVRHISQADDLHRALHAIADAATAWYTDRVAAVFRTVHGPVQHVRRDSPQAVVSAFINLYQAVFTVLFRDLVNGTPLRDLESQAHELLRDDSPEYRAIVHRVLQATMMQRVFQHQPPAGSSQHPPPARPRARERHPPQGPTPTVIPRVIRNGIPEVAVLGPDGKPVMKGGKAVTKAVCLRFQAHSGCSFRACKHAHELHRLPDDVLAWLTRHHGALKPGHPQA